MPAPLSWTDQSDRIRAVFGLVRRVRQAARLADHLRLLQLLLGRGRWDYASLPVSIFGRAFCGSGLVQQAAVRNRYAPGRPSL